MKIVIYVNALSPHNQDALRAVLQKQFEENNAQMTHIATEEEVPALISRNQDLVAALYVIDRAIAED